MTRMHLLVERNLMVYRHTWSLLVAEVFEPVLYLLTIGIGVQTIASTAQGALTTNNNEAQALIAGVSKEGSGQQPKVNTP